VKGLGLDAEQRAIRNAGGLVGQEQAREVCFICFFLELIILNEHFLGSWNCCGIDSSKENGRSSCSISWPTRNWQKYVINKY
jgi:hypothetical protein